MGLILNREIKFRVWNTDTKSFYDDVSMDISGVIRDNQGWWADYELIVQQYTGLKDKNDKEIYQGDVLIYESEIREHEGRSTKAGEIVWYDNFCWAFRYGDKNDVWFLNSDFDFEKCKVIGNIFENPELLK